MPSDLPPFPDPDGVAAPFMAPEDAPPFIRAMTDQAMSHGHMIFAEVAGPYIGFCQAEESGADGAKAYFHAQTLLALRKYKDDLELGLMYVINALVEEWCDRYNGINGLLEAMEDGTFFEGRTKDELPPEQSRI